MLQAQIYRFLMCKRRIIMADNQKMWAELGMNLELHDMLCEVLPGAIGDVFMSQENRPEAMDYFDMVLADVHGLRPSELV